MSPPPRIPAKLKQLLLANKGIDVNISADVILAEQTRVVRETSSGRSYKQALVGDENDSPRATPAAPKDETVSTYVLPRRTTKTKLTIAVHLRHCSPKVISML